MYKENIFTYYIWIMEIFINFVNVKNTIMSEMLIGYNFALKINKNPLLQNL